MLPYLEIADVEALIKILGEAADPRVEMTVADRKYRLLEGMGRLIDADVWLWTVGCTNPDLVGDAMAVSVVDGGWVNEHERAELLRLIIHPDMREVVTAPLHYAVLELRPMTLVRSEIDDDQWRSSPIGQAWRELGFNDFMISVYPLGEFSFSAIGYHRRFGRPAFTERERTLAHVMLLQLDWLHRHETDIPAKDKVLELSPRERQVMLLLMGGDSRKQIAMKMGLSPHTVADYQKGIHEKLGVTSRAELLAKFIPVGR